MLQADLALRIPDLSPKSILEQTDWPCGFYQFPPRYKVQYFNPGLADWLGVRWLVVRRRRCAFNPGKNDITFWRLSNNVPVSEHPLKIPTIRADEHWEDPRVILFNGNPWVSYSNFYTRCLWVHQGLMQVNTHMQASSLCHPVYGGNGPSISANTGHEKNWLWFQDRSGELRMIYAAFPHTVVRFDKEGHSHSTTAKGFRWTKGIIRGGTPPVFVEEDGMYWTFFHSSVEISPTPPRRRYYMGAYAFEAMPPYRIVRRTSIPLLVGNGRDFREPSAPLCVFPCGALLDAGTWHVSLGVNDCACAWIKIPHEELFDRTIKLR